MRRKKRKQKDPWKTRAESLEFLGFETYADYLGSSLWRSIKKRRHSLKNGRLCAFCSSKATQLHHNSYDLKTMAGRKLEALLPVCARCHGEGSKSVAGWVLSPSAATQKMRRLAGVRVDKPLRKRRAKKPKLKEVEWAAECKAALDDLASRQRSAKSVLAARRRQGKRRRRAARRRPKR